MNKETYLGVVGHMVLVLVVLVHDHVGLVGLGVVGRVGYMVVVLGDHVVVGVGDHGVVGVGDHGVVGVGDHDDDDGSVDGGASYVRMG